MLLSLNEFLIHKKNVKNKLPLTIAHKMTSEDRCLKKIKSENLCTIRLKENTKDSGSWKIFVSLSPAFMLLDRTVLLTTHFFICWFP